MEAEETEAEGETEAGLILETKNMTLTELLADEGEVYLAVADLLNEAFQSEVRSSIANQVYTGKRGHLGVLGCVKQSGNDMRQRQWERYT